MRSITAGLLGVATLAACLLVVRQVREGSDPRPRTVPAGETHPAQISLERIRALGH